MVAQLAREREFERQASHVAPQPPVPNQRLDVPRASRSLSPVTAFTPAPTPVPSNAGIVHAHPVRKDAKLDPPPLFTGQSRDFRKFRTHVTLHFTMPPNAFLDEESKVFFVINRLDGTPFNWTQKIVENPHHALRHDFTAFWTRLAEMYIDPNHIYQMQERLEVLKQTRSVAEYAAQFESLLEELDADDSEQTNCACYYSGLKDNVKCSLSLVPCEPTLRGLVRQTVRMDQNYTAVRPTPNFRNNNNNGNHNHYQPARVRSPTQGHAPYIPRPNSNNGTPASSSSSSLPDSLAAGFSESAT